jgi:hypothetical protein
MDIKGKNLTILAPDFYSSHYDGHSYSETDKCYNGFAKFNMIPGATGVTGSLSLSSLGITGATGSTGIIGMQTFAFSSSTVNNNIMMLDINNNNAIVVNKDGWYSLDFQYTLVNDPAFVTGLYYYTGVMINDVILIDSRRYEYMIPQVGNFSGVSNPKSTSFVYLSKGNRIKVFFDCGGTMPLTLKPLTSSVLNITRLK